MNKQFDNCIKIELDGSKEYVNRAIEYARWLGFESEAAEFPVTSLQDGHVIPNSFDEFENYDKEWNNNKPENYISALTQAEPITDFDWRRERGLENVFSKGEFLIDSDNDQLPDIMNFHMIIRDYNDMYLVEAACNMAFRFGMETTAYEGNLLSDEEIGNRIVFERCDRNTITMEKLSDGCVINVRGNGESLIAMVAEFCMKFPLQGEFDTWSDRLQEIGDGFRLNTLDGQLAYISSSKDVETAYVNPDIDNLRQHVESNFPNIQFVNYKKPKEVYSNQYDFSWEVDDVRVYLDENIYPQIAEHDQIKIRIAVSEDKNIRNQLKAEIVERIKALNAEADVRIYCSYKQGFSWIDEDVLENLSRCSAIEELCIKFKPFLKPGESEWTDEDGATPSHNRGDNDEDSWMDLPIRYLQELYPIEDVVVKKCDISPENVKFEVYDGEENITYLVEARDSSGNVVYSDTYLAACDERPYLNRFPQLGKVHPATGYLRVEKNGKYIAEERIVTDVEKIWDTFQENVLKDLESYVDERTVGKNLVDAQPFFSRIELEIESSEPNERLDSREDIISTLDGLHEDIYFAGTDFFKNYGKEKCGNMTDSPGLILPIIRKVNGKGSTMRVRVYAQEAEEPKLVSGEIELVNKLDYDQVDVWIRAYEINNGVRTVFIKVNGVPEEVVSTYAELLDRGVLEMSSKLYGVDCVVFETANSSYESKIIEPAGCEKNVDINDIQIPQSDVIGYEEAVEIFQQLKHVEGINVYTTTKSYMGRDVYAVEFAPNRKGYLSRTKRITGYPTELLNNRHHANEVSATNAAFTLIKKILTEPQYSELTEHMNLVVIPMENTDGTAIHYELQKENPNWKLHVARFNAIGKEFYADHFEMHTIHTEAIGLRRLFTSMLPDVIVDDHGVPSHEWEQQFSGYTSPSFKGFWLPRSLLYGYFFHVKGEGYEGNIDLCKKMEDVIADAFIEDKAITQENLDWARQFEKYAHSWLPKLFPASYYKNMINYWIGSPFNPNHKYPSIRYPWIVSMDYVSEVADETAQGEYMKRCARAHIVHDTAIIQKIMDAGLVYDNQKVMTDNEIKVKHIRQRPIYI